ncbi:nucleotide exchange factor GrpE [Gorillibacterium timonense]|uniref:nucleotide exchange factor GrpE n=1 Tax=Gorillibacterium timonense TaxID=1689269 RepID=UPI00071C8500|nr:nucleotide exchange factor GrpE [Gorillibacterium timonense]
MSQHDTHENPQAEELKRDEEVLEQETAEAGQEETVVGDAADQVARLEKELQESLERSLRAQADFDNFRRRTRQEKEEFAKYASSKVIGSLLPVVDNFERALDSSRETRDFDALLKGLEMTFRQLEQLLSQEGVTKMETVGQPFNPELHQAVMQVESDEYEEGTVVEEVMKGYTLGDKILRPAMVKVSS